jgi:hypothetical protein
VAIKCATITPGTFDLMRMKNVILLKYFSVQVYISLTILTFNR